MRNAIVMLLGIGFLYACSAPVGPIAGGRLEGVPTAWPDDWAFTDEIDNVLLQTRPHDPYSVTIWAVSTGSNIYIAAAEKDANWVQNINQDANVILSVNGLLYAAQATTVANDQEAAKAIQAYVVKYDFDSPEDFVKEEGILFRLSQP